MSLFRCAACGSKNVSTDIQTAGIKYDYVKGAVGTVLLGAGGAAAGITSKEQRVYKCSDCGVTLTYPMPEELKRIIDEGVEFADRREHLSFQGSLMPWEVIKRNYKNIEFGNADKELEEKNERSKSRAAKGIEVLKTKGTATKEEFENSIQTIHRLFVKFDPDEYIFDIKAEDYGETLFSEENLPSITDYLT